MGQLPHGYVVKEVVGAGQPQLWVTVLRTAQARMVQEPHSEPVAVMVGHWPVPVGEVTTVVVGGGETVIVVRLVVVGSDSWP